MQNKVVQNKSIQLKIKLKKKKKKPTPVPLKELLYFCQNKNPSFLLCLRVICQTVFFLKI